jgi:hypothetical protein
VSVGCYDFSYKGGNGSPNRYHALFERDGARDIRLKSRDLFTSKHAVCAIIGGALSAYHSSVLAHTAHTTSQWAAMCDRSTTLVSEDSIFVEGSKVGFDLPYEYWPTGNSPDPLLVEIATLSRVARD